MAWGDSSRDRLVAENAAVKAKVEMLETLLAEKREEVKELKAQLMRTQEALIAKESPEAYRDQKYDEERFRAEESMTEEERRARRIQQEQTEVARNYLSNIESPLFKDADDMIQLLSRTVGFPEPDAPLYDGGES